MGKPALKILLAAPRGFCAGVERAIEIVERALVLHGAPIYVRHEIVHNRFVVENLERKGAVFIDELDQAPDGARVIFSAHGVPKAVTAEAARRGLLAIDATCPLVTKVHREAERHHGAGRHVLMIGHAGHAEVEGTMGQLPPGAISLVETAQAAETIEPENPERLAYVTQTTLSVDEAGEIIAVLRTRFPTIAVPRREDICYATTNRQVAVKVIAARCDAFVVVGAANSSNSRRLVEVARRTGCARAELVARAVDVDWPALAGIATLGLSAGASAPEVLVEEVIDAARRHFTVEIEEVRTAEEDMFFKLPPELRAPAA